MTAATVLAACGGPAQEAGASSEANPAGPSPPPPSATQPSPAPRPTPTATTTAAIPVATPTFRLTVPGAVAMNVASNGTDAPVVAWIQPGEVAVARLDVPSASLASERIVNHDVMPIAHPVERPGLGIRADGTVEVAFTSFSGSRASVYHVIDGGKPTLVSGSPRPETNMVHIAPEVDGTTLLAWLEDSTLSVGIGQGNAVEEHEAVDDLTCDCCNPAPIISNDTFLVAYRDFEWRDARIVRNVASIRSADRGASFEPPVPISDDDWFLDGCPFSGPSVVEVNGSLVVAWMDGRQSIHPDQTTSTIWVDRSSDGGESFGVDVPVASGAIHRWPVMAVDTTGTIHLVWETQGSAGGLSYATSHDSGTSFGEPRLLIDRSSGDGPPKSPSIAHHGGLLIITWTDTTGGHIAAWNTRSD